MSESAPPTCTHCFCLFFHVLFISQAQGPSIQSEEKPSEEPERYAAPESVHQDLSQARSAAGHGKIQGEKSKERWKMNDSALLLTFVWKDRICQNNYCWGNEKYLGGVSVYIHITCRWIHTHARMRWVHTWLYKQRTWHMAGQSIGCERWPRKVIGSGPLSRKSGTPNAFSIR